MKGKQILKKGKPVKGEARTEHGETKERCNLTLTPTAIASLDAFATQLNISRSELVEQYARRRHLVEAVLDAVEDVLYNGTSTEECLPPHPSYEVDGDVFRKLASAFTALTEAEGRR